MQGDEKPYLAELMLELMRERGVNEEFICVAQDIPPHTPIPVTD